ncbi:fido domain-containing protein [Chaetomium tenue]|uniref:Fido domain-containing protein n=1 Tax=Chaetomium tenue TaxID=1854479 RepID=A0ACB7PQ75_9PEZI|nr:fido domain-containing protein [Chaetomium globosum]
MRNLAQDIPAAISTGRWPSWKLENSQTFTVRLAHELREEARRERFVADPANIIDKVRAGSQRSSSAQSVEAWEALEAALIRLVYGSNMIESAGNTLKITLKLCQAVFRGEGISTDIEERDPEYQEQLEHLVAANRPAGRQHVIRSRQEIVQHAQALNHMIDHIVLNKEPWSEDLILETHRILHHGLDDEVESGKYREYEVAVKYEKPGQKGKSSLCMRARAIPGYMKEMVEHLNQEIAQGEESGSLDPYTLAARYHHQFVNIHPFGDGNGRIILNCLLLRYAGHTSDIGLDPDERDHYIAIATRASRVFHSEDMEVDFDQHTGHRELAKFILAKSKRNLERLWNWASKGKGAGDEAK